MLKDALLQCTQGQYVLIASPWITVKAIEEDGLSELVRSATHERKGQVKIVVDRELHARDAKHRGQEALKILRASGAVVKLVNRMHNKTLIISPSQIIEGSFNWLSARRRRDDDLRRHEVSWHVSGQAAKQAIKSALEELSQLED